MSAPRPADPAPDVAALFVETGGVYFGLPGVDPWDAARDARLYAGPWPVVAHPPCQLWVNFAALNFKRYGGEHNRPGNDGGCFASALASVRRWGGVLEHPASSNAWPAHGLARPIGTGWSQIAPREWVCEVWQSAYGHPARKRTWLFYSGDHAPHACCWDRRPGTHQVGWFDRKKPTLSKAEASRTPPAFRDLLLGIARGARARRRLIRIIKKQSQTAGGCNFCNRHTTEYGETNHTIYEISGSDTALYVRFCRDCLDAIARAERPA